MKASSVAYMLAWKWMLWNLRFCSLVYRYILSFRSSVWKTINVYCYNSSLLHLKVHWHSLLEPYCHFSSTGYRTNYGWKAWTDSDTCGASTCCHALPISLWGNCQSFLWCSELISCLLIHIVEWHFVWCFVNLNFLYMIYECFMAGIFWEFYWFRARRWRRTRHIRFSFISFLMKFVPESCRSGLHFGV